LPVVQAKEALLPRLTNVNDNQAALEKIRQRWPQILEQVKAQRISLGAFLELGMPMSLADGTLQICFDQGSGFQINSVNNQKTFIQEVIMTETGYRLRLICRKEESNALHELRAQMQKPAAVGSASPHEAAMTEGTQKNDAPLAPVVEKANGNEAAGKPVNGTAKIATSETPHREAPAPPATLGELYLAYPPIKKLIEALDGELI
jgi:hypothetical protein